MIDKISYTKEHILSLVKKYKKEMLLSVAWLEPFLYL